MIAKIAKQMSGEKLLLMRIFKGNRVGPMIKNELDRRALSNPMPRRKLTENNWAGRTFAMRRSARLAA